MLKINHWAILILLLFQGCTALIERAPTTPGPPLVLIDGKDTPPFLDDLDWASLDAAIEGSLRYYNHFSEKDVFRVNGTTYSVKDFKETLSTFAAIVKSHDTDVAKQKRIVETFDIYKAAGFDNEGTVLFTGYYEPILDGSLEPTDRYKYPLFKTPVDLLKIVPETCKDRQGPCDKVIGRLDNGKYTAYYSREDIDTFGALQDKNLEIAWLADPVERYYLHIQGSGKIRLPDGSHIRISYAQSNGRPYRSIGACLLENNKLTKKELTHQTIKAYLRNHPDEIADIFNYNERYIFFRVVDDGPLGSIGVVVTPGRSIATDPKCFPKGILAFIKLTKPVLDPNQKAVDRLSISRFVLNQDEGSAIKGSGRVDLFCGTGEDAELFAGSLKEKGELYFLLKKKMNR